MLHHMAKKKKFYNVLCHYSSFLKQLFWCRHSLNSVCVWLVTQSCLTLCDPMDCNLLASSVHGISQARILEWIAITSSRGSSQPGTPTWVSWSPAWAGRFSLYHRDNIWEKVEMRSCTKDTLVFILIIPISIHYSASILLLLLLLSCFSRVWLCVTL